MTSFLLIAGCMLLAAVACVLVPWWRAAGTGNVRSRALPALALLVLLPALAMLLYAALGDRRWQATALPSVEDMVASLEQRLAEEPGDLAGWMLLGRSYVVMQRYADASRAFERAYRLSDGRDPAVVTAYAESLALEDSTTLDGRAGELFDQALALEPGDPKALWYGGLAAFVRGDLAVARERWNRLRALNPPQAVDDLLADRVAEIDRRLGAPPPVAESSAPAAAAPSAGVELSIVLDPSLRGRVAPGATLFVIARREAEQGPPLAVVRRPATDLPLTVRLTDADAMLPGRSLSDYAVLELVARISASGQPLPASGDLSGESVYRRGASEPVELTIDHVIP